MQRVSSERSAVVARAEQLMTTIQPARLERADSAALEVSIAASQAERERVKEDNERKRTRISHLRASIAARRQALTVARTSGHSATTSQARTPPRTVGDRILPPNLSAEAGP